jgi:two-component system nitrate/nitrite response regulator NarL
MRLLLIDDHTLFRAGLARIVQFWQPEATIRAVGTLGEGLRCLREAPPDLVLLDLTLPDAQAAHPVASLLACAPNVPVLVISMLDTAEAVSEALRFGARGYLHKTEDETVMVKAIALVLAGGSAVPAWYERRRNAQPPPPAAPGPLSPRQQEVLSLIEQGRSNKEIARALGIAEATVKIHVHNLLKALGTDSRQKAAYLSRQQR